MRFQYMPIPVYKTYLIRQNRSFSLFANAWRFFGTRRWLVMCKVESRPLYPSYYFLDSRNCCIWSYLRSLSLLLVSFLEYSIMLFVFSYDLNVGPVTTACIRLRINRSLLVTSIGSLA